MTFIYPRYQSHGRKRMQNNHSEMILIFQKSWKPCGEKDIKLMKVIEWFSFFRVMKTKLCKINESHGMISFFRTTKVIQWEWCKSNETNGVILIFSEKSKSWNENDAKLLKLMGWFSFFWNNQSHGMFLIETSKITI